MKCVQSAGSPSGDVVHVKCKCLFPLSCRTAHPPPPPPSPASPPQNKFPLFLEGHLSRSSGLLCHQDRASKPSPSLPVSLPRCSGSARCHHTLSSRRSLSCQLPCQPAMAQNYQGQWKRVHQRVLRVPSVDVLAQELKRHVPSPIKKAIFGLNFIAAYRHSTETRR